MLVTSYGRNKNRDDEIKKQEKADNSPSHRCAAIKTLLENAAREQKISLAYRIFFHTSISRSLENSDINNKPLSFRSTLHFVKQQNHSTNFFTCFISRFRIHSKKGLLQYSSSSRKKTAPKYNSNSSNCNKKLGAL